MENILIYAGLGAGAGLLAGMLGVGGGQVIVPGLLYLFHIKAFAPEVSVHMALGTSLATIVITSFSSARSHAKRRALDWDVLKKLAPGMVIGAILGGSMSGLFSATTLRTAFGVFLIFLAVQMAFALKPAPQRTLPGATGMFGVGALFGWVSALVGVGGGSMVVPFLAWCNVNMKVAVGTASACGVPLALAGGAGFVFAGWSDARLPEWSFGYIYLPAFAGVAACSLLFTPVGVAISHRLPIDILKRIFALFLAIAGVRILT